MLLVVFKVNHLFRNNVLLHKFTLNGKYFITSYYSISIIIIFSIYIYTLYSYKHDTSDNKTFQTIINSWNTCKMIKNRRFELIFRTPDQYAHNRSIWVTKIMFDICVLMKNSESELKASILSNFYAHFNFF